MPDPSLAPSSAGLRPVLQAAGVWVAGWLAMAGLFGPLRPYWFDLLPLWLIVAVSFLPLGVLLATTLQVMVELARMQPTSHFLLGLGALAAAGLLTASHLLPSSVGTVTQGPLLLLLGAAAGLGLTRGVQEKEWILPLLTILALVDLWSVLAGPTKALMEDEVGLVVAEKVIVTYPSAAGEAESFGVIPYFGFPDALAMALFIGLALRFGLSLRATIVALVAGMVAALTLAAVTESGLPALPYLCGAFVIAHLPSLKPDPATARIFLRFMAALAVILAVAQVLLRL